MPFFFGMLETSMERYPNYPFYGYINGDILVENTITSVLQQVHKDILSGKLGDKVSLFTHRKNMFASFPEDSYRNHKESREYEFFVILILVNYLINSIVVVLLTGM